MAYNNANLSLVVQGMTYNAKPRRWVYTTTDATATIDTSGYISDGGKYGMRVGDIVEVYISSGTITVSTYRVVSVDATTGAVDLSDGTVIGSNTNTD